MDSRFALDVIDPAADVADLRARLDGRIPACEHLVNAGGWGGQSWWCPNHPTLRCRPCGQAHAVRKHGGQALAEDIHAVLTARLRAANVRPFVPELRPGQMTYIGSGWEGRARLLGVTVTRP